LIDIIEWSEFETVKNLSGIFKAHFYWNNQKIIKNILLSDDLSSEWVLKETPYRTAQRSR